MHVTWTGSRLQTMRVESSSQSQRHLAGPGNEQRLPLPLLGSRLWRWSSCAELQPEWDFIVLRGWQQGWYVTQNEMYLLFTSGLMVVRSGYDKCRQVAFSETA